VGEPENLAQLLMDHPFVGDKPLLCSVGEEVSADKSRSIARSIAGRLCDLGVRPGQGVAVQLPSGPGLVAAMFGTWLAGAVFVPVNIRQPDKEVEHVLQSMRPAAYLAADHLALLPDPMDHGGDVAFVTWTSGTTGPPRAILQTHGGYLELLDRVLAPLRAGAPTAAGAHTAAGAPTAPTASRDDPMPNLVPVSVALNAGIYNVLFGLRAGAAIVLMEEFSTTSFAELVQHYGIRSTVLPPAAMVMLTEDGAVTDLKPLRYVRSITAPLSPLSARRFMDKFSTIVLNGYGQAEVGEVIGWTAADAKAHPDKLGAAGRPHPGVAIKVVTESGTPVELGEPGELLVRPPRMAQGYAGGSSLDDRIDDEGFVRTGDFAIVDDEGFVWIEGRTSDLINRGGNKVFPDQVEEVLLLASGVREAAVVAVPDERLGQVPVAFFVGRADDDELESLCREHLTPYKIPVAFRRVDSIPRSEVGKVLRSELARSFTG
jgi:long-chain acyl-CoA synthetase